MSFTRLFVTAYELLLIFTIVSFVKKKKRVGIALISVMVLGIAVLGYLWMTSPM
ncbi:MAG: hypothetical protein K6F65_00100 [Lachnospiraceae bacterium]|nr:hypothetical protein [Lachnospiraceae bacterium]